MMTPADDPTGQNQHPSRSPRFMWWTVLMVSSAVCLAAQLSYIKTNNINGEKDRKDKWIISVTSISMSLSFFAVLFHFVASHSFVAQQPEAATSALLLVFWIAGIPAIMSEATRGVTVANANLYCFGWASLVSSIAIVGHYGQTVVGSVDFTKAPPRLVKWFMLTAAAVVLLASSANFHDDFGCGTSDEVGGQSICKRNKLAIAEGVVGAFFGLVMSLSSSRGFVNLLIESVVSATLLIIFTFGVAYVTFGDGPARSLGNQYFSQWTCFVVAILLTIQCIRDELHERGGGMMTNDLNNTRPEIQTQDNIAPSAPGMDDIELSGKD